MNATSAVRSGTLRKVMMSLVSFDTFVVFYSLTVLLNECRRLAINRCGTSKYQFMDEQSSLSWFTSSFDPPSLTPPCWSFFPLFFSSILFVTSLSCLLFRQLQLFCSLLWLFFDLCSYFGWSNCCGCSVADSYASWSCWYLNFFVL